MSRMSDAARKAAAERIRKNWLNPEYREKMKAVSSRNIRTLNAQPEFRAKALEILSEYNSRPDRKAEVSRLMQDEKICEKHRKAVRKYYSTPENNPLALLDKWQRADYDLFTRKKGMRRDEALQVVLKDFPGLLRIIMGMYE